MQRLTRLVPLLFLIITFTAKAQFKKGTRMAGASIASLVINSGTSDQTITMIGNQTAKVTGFSASLTPSLGWFVSENTAVGVSLNFNPYSEKTSYEENGSTYQRDKANNFSIGIGGFVRNYFAASGSVLPFGQFAFDAGPNSRKTDGFYYGGSSPNVYKRTYTGHSSGGFSFNGYLTGGITKMIGELTGLDLYVGYNYSYYKNTMNTTTLTDDLVDGTIDETAKNELITKYTNHRFMFGIGFQVFFEKQKK